MSVLADLRIIIDKTLGIFKCIKVLWTGPIWLLGKINIFKKTIKLTEVVITPKVGIIEKIKNVIKPRAKLTYWLADEEVIVYVSTFHQKDKFKLVYTEIETGRKVMVNSSQPINYRLEELKAGDSIQTTEIQQNQRY